jgi:hypothetical protein
MNCMKNRLRTALLAGMVLLAVSGFTILTVHAHSHSGGGGGGDKHHSEHPHEHYSAGDNPNTKGSGYHHSHDDLGKHDHDCRPVSITVAPSQANTSDEECQDHDGNWEPSQGD